MLSPLRGIGGVYFLFEQYRVGVCGPRAATARLPYFLRENTTLFLFFLFFLFSGCYGCYNLQCIAPSSLHNYPNLLQNFKNP